MSNHKHNFSTFTAKRPPRGAALIADDEPTVLKLAEMMLQQLGFFVYSALDGREAMGLLASHASDIRVILLDLTMPEMNGIETLQAIRAIHKSVPVILCTGHSVESIPAEILQLEHTHFLAKPFPFRELERLVNAVVPRPA